MRGNCLWYALPRWLAGYVRQRYLIIRKSDTTIWPHFMLTEDISQVEVEEFIPLKQQTGWRALLSALWFKGRVRKGKGEGD